MITISDLSLNFSGEPLFKDVNLKFTQGNCYGVIGANGAGKSTFLRILSGDLDPSTGTVSIAPKTRMIVLKQDHFAFNEETVLNTVLGGTSLAVYPAAGLIDYYRGNKLVLVNKSPTPADRRADLVIHAPIGEVFSQL